MKRVLLGLTSFIALISNAQSVFINELHYDNTGGDVDEGTEIAGPQGTDLTGYKIYYYNGNGGVMYDSTELTGFLPNQQNGYGTINFPNAGIQNGPDAVALVDDQGTLIQFLSYEGTFAATDGPANGMMSVDMGVSETSGTAVGSSMQLVGTGTVYSDFTWTNQTQTRDLVNTNQNFGGGALDTLVTISTADLSVFETAGNIDAEVVLNFSATIDKTVDFVLDSGNAAIVSGFNSQMITFTGGSQSELVNISVATGQLSGGIDTLKFILQNPSSDLVLGNDTTFRLIVSALPPGPAPCSNLFISEYIEGSSNNKALELYNPTIGIIDLSTYELRRYNNGATTPSSTLSLSGNLVPGEVFVIANSQSDFAILAQTDLTSGFCSFNGDDAVELYDTVAMQVIDVIGVVGNDPGASWNVGTGATANNTLVRKATIDAGATAWTGFGDQQYDVLANDDFTNLGAHSNTSCTASVPLTAYPTASALTVCVGDTISFSHTTFGGTAPYLAGWTIDGVPFSTGNVNYTRATAGVISVTLGISDAGGALDDSTFTVEFLGLPNGGVNLPTDSTCVGNTLNFTSTAGADVSSHSYSDLSTTGTLNFVGSTGSGDFSHNTAGIYDIIQTVVDTNGCSNETTFTLYFIENEDASFPTPSVTCEGDTLMLMHPNNTGTWSGSGVTDLGNGNGFINQTAGSYPITYTISGLCGDAYTDTAVFVALPVADFTFSGEPTVTFTNNSTGGVVFDWDFDDGNTSTDNNPTNTYAANGTYTVELTATSAEGCISTSTNDVTISTVSVIENEFGFHVFPNPFTDVINVNSNINISVSVSNIIGEVVFSNVIDGNQTINLGHLPSGSYLITLSNSENSITKKIVKK